MSEVALIKLMDEFKLKLITKNVDINNKSIKYSDINRPALQLSGFLDYFDCERLQIIGLVEHTYLSQLNQEERINKLNKIFEFDIPCVVVCRGLEVFQEMIDAAEANDTPIFVYTDSTTDFVYEAIRFLRMQLAPMTSMHGVLVDVYGEGLLIVGESGIGKSETALELIKRGHRLVADDNVLIKRVSKDTLLGSSPPSIKHFIELRGVGIINVLHMFGAESVKITHSIDLVIKLENWDQNKEYERIGDVDKYIEILGNRITCHNIPIRPGRNLAIICESAAVNHRQKKMGFNAAKSILKTIFK